jgi:predicted ATPase
MDRITRVWFKNLRTLADVSLDLSGLTVLVGDNGAGKSTLLEGLALLRRCVDRELLNKLNQVHGGIPALLRLGENRLTLGARIDGETALEYEVTFQAQREYGAIAIEREIVRGESKNSRSIHTILERDARSVRIWPTDSSTATELPPMRPFEPALYGMGLQPKDSPFLRVGRALNAVRVHAPLDLCGIWAANEGGSPAPLRSSARLQPFSGLGVRGGDLQNAYQALRNEVDTRPWEETLELIQLGLGDEVENVVLRPDPAGGMIALQIKYRQHREPVHAAALSDGTLAWLAFVAIHQTREPGALLVVDEPELHLHPGLVRRTADLFESIAKSGPVLLSTHSDHLLDALQTPAESVVVCELDAERRTQLRRPNVAALEDWMRSYAGYGSIRTAGHEESVLEERNP